MKLFLGYSTDFPQTTVFGWKSDFRRLRYGLKKNQADILQAVTTGFDLA
jgi:hypothetical protein